MTSHDAAVEIVALNVFGIADRCGRSESRESRWSQWRVKRDRSTDSAALSMIGMDRDECTGELNTHCWHKGQRQYAFQLDLTDASRWRHAAIAARVDYEPPVVRRVDAGRGTSGQYQPAPYWRA